MFIDHSNKTIFGTSQNAIEDQQYVMEGVLSRTPSIPLSTLSHGIIRWIDTYWNQLLNQSSITCCKTQLERESTLTGGGLLLTRREITFNTERIGSRVLIK